MFRPTFLTAFTLASTLAVSTAQAQDINGTWRIASSATGDGSSYGGTVTIRPNGDCYTVEWNLDTGDHYSGIGVKAGNALAVAYSSTPENNYGVVLYARNKATGTFNGWWCQPDGTFGVENLSGSTLAGSHQLSGGTSSGTVRIESYGPGSLNFRMHWSGNEEYDGFGTSPSDAFDFLAGVWGRVEGTGSVLYSLANIGEGKLPGWWAASNSGGQGLENLER